MERCVIIKEIYIADDDENVCNLLKSQLVSEDYLVEEFYNGEELLKRFSSQHCSLIITNIMMPQMSGYELCTENTYFNISQLAEVS